MSESKRLFFALWPDEALRQGIGAAAEALAQAVRGRPVPAHNYHVTLRFLGQVEAERREAALEAAAALSAPASSFRLDRYGYWQGPRVAWLGTDRVPDDLLRLVGGLNMELAARGFPVESRRYRPHVTLFRDARPAGDAPLPEPLEWRVREFALVESRPGRPYQVLASWPLKEPEAGQERGGAAARGRG